MDEVNHPQHYTGGPFECIELTKLMPFTWGNCVKYCYRYMDKGKPFQDLSKALWYFDKAVECHHDLALPHRSKQVSKLLYVLQEHDWQELSMFWGALADGRFHAARFYLESSIVRYDGEYYDISWQEDGKTHYGVICDGRVDEAIAPSSSGVAFEAAPYIIQETYKNLSC